MNFFRKKKHKSIIHKLVDFVTKNDTSITFEINNRGYEYKILPLDQSKQWTEDFIYYYSTHKSEFVYDCDFKSVFVFAQIINHGDNEYGLFVDANGKIYHTDSERGCDDGPISVPIAEKIMDLIGVFDFKELDKKNHHFKYPHPIVRIKDIINEQRVIMIGIHGFLIDNYEEIIRQAIEKSKVDLNLESFTYPDIEWHDSEKTHYVVDMRINSEDFQIKIEKSKWFDFELSNQITPILKQLNVNKTLHIVHEEDWDEMHGIVFLDKKERESFQKNRLIIGN